MSNISANDSRDMKLNMVTRRLGLTFLECTKLIRFDESIEIACWIYDKASDEELFIINPNIIDNYQIDVLEMVLRHEALHRSFYNAFRYSFNDEGLSNIVLDIVINKILYTAYPERSKPMFKLYPENSYNTPIVLCIADVEPNRIHDARLRDIYIDIWSVKDIPNPESVYYQLMTLNLNSKDIDVFKSTNPFHKPEKKKCRYGLIYKSMRSALITEANSKIEQNLIGSLKSKTKYYDRANVITKYYSESKRVGGDALKDFVNNIKQIRKLSKITNQVKEDLSEGSRLQVYPMFLSRLGIIYKAMGLNDVLPLYWNKSTNITSGKKPKIALYVDTSHSMKKYSKYIRWIVRQLDDFPFSVGESNKMCYGFSRVVYNLNLNDIAEGKFIDGGGTDFNAPLRHFLALNDDSNTALFFTDGFSTLNTSLTLTYKARKGLLMYTIYFSDRDREIKSPLDEISIKTFTIFISD